MEVLQLEISISFQTNMNGPCQDEYLLMLYVVWRYLFLQSMSVSKPVSTETTFSLPRRRRRVMLLRDKLRRCEFKSALELVALTLTVSLYNS